ncbi:MAG: OsmC family protein [Myxococcales bacterium]|nr:OsmC family protein [Myxococcales bacterium]
MVRIDVEYQGGLRCRAVHAPSGAELVSDAPVDNHGKGASFSPTDTLATSLASCMLTVMGIRAAREGWVIDGSSASVEKHMTTELPRRVARLVVDVEMRAPGLSDSAKQALVDTAETCPVRLSLGEHVAVTTSYRWV